MRSLLFESFLYFILIGLNGDAQINNIFGKDQEFYNFRFTISEYLNQPTDLVFLLDESGSVGVDNFPTETLFTELIIRMFRIRPDHTRVAIITFSSGYIIRLNDMNNANSNMCNVLTDLRSIDYKGGATHTREALRGANDILSAGRNGANRVIILLSDGESNGGDPLPVASALKKNGIVIFSVGIANAQRQELLGIATSSNHLYMIKDFNYIMEVNNYLRKDVVNDFFLPVDEDHCKTSCNSKSACSCGLDGLLTCACRPGYQPIENICEECPFGTYQSVLNDWGCDRCPLNSNTTQTGSVSRDQCHCQLGYHGNPSTGNCVSIKCPKLKKPMNGHLEPFNCPNSVYSNCSFWCENLYCPYNGSEPNCAEKWSRKATGQRTCLPNGHWSGVEFRCEMIRCSKPEDLTYGHYHCDQTDYRFQTRCTLKCSLGYLPVGGNINCIKNGTWRGNPGFCKEVSCRMLAPKKQLLVKPESCVTQNQTFQSKCQLFCVDGYKYIRLSTSEDIRGLPEGQRICGEDGRWKGAKEAQTCKDITPPKIICPPSIVADAQPSSRTSALIHWAEPNATDNDGLPPKVRPARGDHLKGQRIPKSPHCFIIGTNKLVYVATDASKLNSSCSFTVTIRDSEPPSVKFCPKDIELISKNTSRTVGWKEPKFEDNSKEKVTIVLQSSNSPGDIFSPGPPHTIVYKAVDSSGNAAECKFQIKLKAYPCRYYRPPINGIVTCFDSAKDTICTVSCYDGYAFAVKPQPVYLCKKENQQWKHQVLRDEQLWPDCGAKVDPNLASTGGLMQYSRHDCAQREELQMQLTAKLQKLIQQQNSPLAILCADSNKCELKNIRINCEAISNKPRVKRDKDDFVLSLSFDFEIGTNNSQAFNGSKEDLNNILSMEFTKLLQQLSSEDPSLDLAPVGQPTINEVVFKCGTGQVAIADGCVNCPKGSFYNDTSISCFPCPVGTYQEEEGADTCIACPDATTTLSQGTSARSFCVAPCKPGTFSDSGKEQCTACPIGFFQPFYEQTKCFPCLGNKTTWTEGTVTKNNCREACRPGSMSTSGLEPCELCPRASYQPFPQMMSCEPCPGNWSTHQEGATLQSACEDVDFCNPNPCKNGGHCTADSEGNIDCNCSLGFAGRYCEENINDCIDDSCLNNGTCVDGVNDYICHCPPGFSGLRCEDNINDCLEGSCLHGGICIDEIDSYRCECPSGIYGKRCEIIFKNCASRPCLNGGTCFDTYQGFRCCCPEGLAGVLCELSVNDCNPTNPCLNGGTCSTGFNNRTCSCVPGFTGLNCQEDIDDCWSVPCLNNGQCIDRTNGFKCICRSGYFGSTCEKELSVNFDIVFNEVSVANYVEIPYTQDLYAVTVAFWMQAWPERNLRGTPVSFAYSAPVTLLEVTNALTWYDFSKFIIHLQGEVLQTSIVGTSDKKWHHYALTWDSSDGTWSAFKDGVKEAGGTGVGVGVPLWRGIVVLGQEQDKVGGGFSATESFQGKLSQFNVWNLVLNSSQIKSLTNTCGFLGNVISWTNVQDIMRGNLISSDSDLCSGIGKCDHTNRFCFCQGNNEMDSFCERAFQSCTISCSNNGSCRDQGLFAVCYCLPGTTGKFCQYDIDECAFDNGNCSHLCKNRVGSYSCLCPDEFRLELDGHTCTTMAQCLHLGRFYHDGEQWKEEELCLACHCSKGRVTCHPLTCPEPPVCREQEDLILLPTECCHRCIEKAATCRVRSTNLYETFDGANFKFTSMCQHVLSQDCSSASFSVYIQNGQKNVKKKSLIVNINCIIINVNMNGKLLVGKNLVEFKDSIYKTRDFTIAKRTVTPVTSSSFWNENFYSIIISTSEGIIVEWNNVHEISISLPTHMQQKVCGLCGDFNGVAEDDFQKKNYALANSLTDFVLNWQIVDQNGCKPPQYKKPGTPPKNVESTFCDHSSFSFSGINQSEAQRLCKPLRMEPFPSCYSSVDAHEFYELCIADACNCHRGNLCHCDAILSYVQKCKKYGIQLSGWQGEEICALLCRNGMVFDDCGPVCPTTCSQKEMSNYQCQFKTCKAGCHCPSPLVLHEGHCIKLSKCPNKTKDIHT